MGTFPYLEPAFTAIAHRGGAAYAPNVGHENTMEAFDAAVKLGYRYLETDVHGTADGVAVAFHDTVLDRVTDSHGALADLSWEQLRTVRVGGDHRVPRLDDLLSAFPDTRFNLDIKAEGAIAPLAQVLTRLHAHDRVLVTSFSLRRLRAFRRLMGQPVALGAGSVVIASELAAFAVGVPVRFGVASALQCPVRQGGIPVVTQRFVRNAHRAGLKVQVWTIDDPAQIERLIDLGVDGIFSDRIDVLKAVLIQRGLWDA